MYRSLMPRHRLARPWAYTGGLLFTACPSKAAEEYAANWFPVGSGFGRVLEMQSEWGERSHMPFFWRASSLHNRWLPDLIDRWSEPGRS
jgi:hypothetical protein